jgi:hypothetical protein
MPKTPKTKSTKVKDLQPRPEKAEAVRGGTDTYSVRDKQKVEIQNPEVVTKLPQPPPPPTPYGTIK